MGEDVAAGAEEGLPPEDVLRRVRIPFVQRATLTQQGSSEELFIIDVGLSGIFVERPEPLSLGESVVVRFPLPGNELPVVARCRVAWAHREEASLVSKDLPNGSGLEFVEISDADRARIREHVLAHCRRPARTRRFLRHWPQAERKGDDP
jgi:Tfp pilus assembly protein PilZ